MYHDALRGDCPCVRGLEGASPLPACQTLVLQAVRTLLMLPRRFVWGEKALEVCKEEMILGSFAAALL